MTDHTAVSLDGFGGPEVLRLVSVPIPQPGPTEIRVRVRAAGVNPVDAKTRAGKGMASVVGDPPFVPGWDVSGTVDAIGRGVTRFREGERVFGLPSFPHAAGAYAEHVTAPSRQFVATPSELDDVHAAALPMAALTAWQALVDTAHIGDGQRVVVRGAGGGVGHLAVQIARSQGADVVAIASADKHAMLRELGVEQLVDHRGVDPVTLVHDAHVVLDLVGGAGASAAVRMLRPGGLLIVAPGSVPDEAAGLARTLGVETTSILVEPDGAGLAAVRDLVVRGLLRVVVSATFPLREVVAAHVAIESGHTRGKIVLTLD